MESMSQYDSFWSLPTPGGEGPGVLFKTGDKFGYLYAWAEFSLTMSYPELDTAAFTKPLRWAKSKLDLTKVEDDLRIMGGAPSLRSLVEWHDRGCCDSQDDLTNVSSLDDLGSISDLLNISNLVPDLPATMPAHSATDTQGPLAVAYGKLDEDEGLYMRYYRRVKAEDIEQTQGEAITYPFLSDTKDRHQPSRHAALQSQSPDVTCCHAQRRPETTGNIWARLRRFLHSRTTARYC